DRFTERAVLESGGHRLVFTPDSETLITAADFGITLWDVTEKKVRKCPGPELRYTVSWLSFAPDGKTLGIGGHRRVSWWNVDGHTLTQRGQLPDRKNLQHAAAFAAGGRVLATANDPGRGEIEVWDIGGARPIQAVTLKGHSRWVYALAYSPDGK